MLIMSFIMCCAAVGTLTAPLKPMGGGYELVMKKKKPMRSQALSKYICTLIFSENITSNHILMQDLLANKMIVDLYMLGLSIIDGIRGQSKGSNVVTPQFWWRT
jgi:hypothetical protein